MDAFADHFVTESDIDPAADFLAREQDQLAGLEDDILAEIKPQTVQDDYLECNIGDNSVPASGYGETVKFDNDSFDATVENDFIPQVFPTTIIAAPQPSIPREEPEKIRKWREEQKKRLQQKDEEEEKKKTEMREQARRELEEWYHHHKETVEKTRAANRSAEKDLVSQPIQLEPGQEWERIAKLCDFNPKASRNSKDVSRMRSIILQLKQTPPVRESA